VETDLQKLISEYCAIGPSPPGCRAVQSAEKITLFPSRVNGIGWRPSFYEVEANLDWIHSLSLVRCACVQLGADSW
jgi:hypothetical protein